MGCSAVKTEQNCDGALGNSSVFRALHPDSIFCFPRKTAEERKSNFLGIFKKKTKKARAGTSL